MARIRLPGPPKLHIVGRAHDLTCSDELLIALLAQGWMSVPFTLK